MTRTIREEQDEFVAAYNAVADPLLQYDMLLSLYSDLPRLPPEEKTQENLIRGCVSRVWLACGYEDGRVRLRVESEALIVGGIAGVIVRLLDGRTPGEILEAELDFIRRTPLERELSTDRRRGMGRLISRIRDYARDCLRPDASAEPRV